MSTVCWQRGAGPPPHGKRDGGGGGGLGGVVGGGGVMLSHTTRIMKDSIGLPSGEVYEVETPIDAKDVSVDCTCKLMGGRYQTLTTIAQLVIIRSR